MRSHDPTRGAELWRPDSGTSMMLELSLIYKVQWSQSVWVVFMCTAVLELPVITQRWFICWVSLVGRWQRIHLQFRSCRRFSFDPWVGKIPWRRAWQPTPVFLPGESHGQGAWWATAHGVANSQTRLKRLSMRARFICSRVNGHLVSSCWMPGTECSMARFPFGLQISGQWAGYRAHSCRILAEKEN